MPYTITALPAAPSRSMAPATFSLAADTFLSALPTFATEMNALATAFNDIEASVLVVEAAIDMEKWISGTTYDEGDVVWSPANYQSYRRKTNGGGTTDPSLDTTNWASIGVGEARTWTTEQTFDGGVIVTAEVREAPTVANTTASYTVDVEKGTLFDLTLNAATVTFTFPAATAGRQFTLLLKQDETGSRAISWPASVRWAGSGIFTPTAAAGSTDVVSFVADGTFWLAFIGGQDYTRS